MRQQACVSMGLMMGAVVLMAAMPSVGEGQTTTRVSVNSQGEGANGFNGSPVISVDGRFVAFSSDATNLESRVVAGVPVNDTNNASDIFVHDRQAGETTRVSVDSNGAQANNGGSFEPAMSADGRFVAFLSFASNLVPGDTNDKSDIFVHDRQRGITTRVNVPTGGGQTNKNSSNDILQGPAISANGQFVAFESQATNLVPLVPGDTNGKSDIFVHNRQTAETTRVSVNSHGDQANGDNVNSAISADGRFVAFESDASNLVVGDGNGLADVFVHDRQTGETTRVSVNSNAKGTIDNPSLNPTLSADGRFVAFQSSAENLLPGKTNRTFDIFVHDRLTGETTRVSVDSNGAQANGDNVNPAISAGGRMVAFDSNAMNLVSSDTNNLRDIFVHDQQTGQTTWVNVPTGGGQANGLSFSPALSGDGRYVAFASEASNLVAGDGNGNADVFVHDRGPAAVPLASLSASVLPTSRSVQVGTTATAFGLLINGGTTTGTSCSIAPSTSIPATFSYQTTDPNTNALTGSPNTPVDIPAGGTQTFVMSFTPTAAFSPTDVALNFSCTNTFPASSTVGLNTLLLSASATFIPDIVAVAITSTNDGIVHLPGSTGGIGSTGAFAVGSLNAGATGTMTVSADTGNVSLPLAIMLCQTDTATGVCLAPPSSSVTTVIVANTTPSFGVFVEGLGPVPFDPATNRIFIRFKDTDGTTRGSTSVAVQTP